MYPYGIMWRSLPLWGDQKQHGQVCSATCYMLPISYNFMAAHLCALHASEGNYVTWIHVKLLFSWFPRIQHFNLSHKLLAILKKKKNTTFCIRCHSIGWYMYYFPKQPVCHLSSAKTVFWEQPNITYLNVNGSLNCLGACPFTLIQNIWNSSDPSKLRPNF